MLWALFSPKRDQNRRWGNGGVLAEPSNLELKVFGPFWGLEDCT